MYTVLQADVVSLNNELDGCPDSLICGNQIELSNITTADEPLVVYSHNVSGMKTKFMQIQRFLTSTSADVINVQETWFDSTVADGAMCVQNTTNGEKCCSTSLYHKSVDDLSKNRFELIGMKRYSRLSCRCRLRANLSSILSSNFDRFRI